MMDKALKPIGIIGGMGPDATAYFMRRVIALTYAQDDKDHIPYYVDMNPQVPSRLAALVDQNGENPGPVLAQMAQGLAVQGAQALVMPCNTAHHYADYIAKAVAVPLLHMIDLSAKLLMKDLGQGARIGMLSSPATDKHHIFQSIFDAYDLTAVFPEKAQHVLSLIRQVKASGPAPQITRDLTALTQELEASGVKAILIGCSEFSMMNSDIETPLPVYDTVDILAREAIRVSGGVLR